MSIHPHSLPARIAQTKPIPYLVTIPLGVVEPKDALARWRSTLCQLRDAVTSAFGLVLSTQYGGPTGRAEQLETVKRGFELLAEQAAAAAAAIGDQLAEQARRRS
ncbi:MAG: hypothetical protein KIS61_09450 [Candidatus Eremiobacteraeota bacterium]|nr:hypothetical protein [Candidatus Eremiobacteraeota bacterium]